VDNVDKLLRTKFLLVHPRSRSTTVLNLSATIERDVYVTSDHVKLILHEICNARA
jgi:hypothetical protein